MRMIPGPSFEEKQQQSEAVRQRKAYCFFFVVFFGVVAKEWKNPPALPTETRGREAFNREGCCEGQEGGRAATTKKKEDVNSLISKGG